MVAVRALVFTAAALWIGLACAQPQSAPSTSESPASSSLAPPSSAAPSSAAPNSPAPNPTAPSATAPSATAPNSTTPSFAPPSGQPVVSHPPTADDICRAVEQDAAENEIPVEFFARVIWQESRFNALAVSKKGAQGIAQFMPATADYRGLVDPFDPIESLQNSARYLRDLKQQFGNLGLAAAAYNAGPGRVSAWLTSRRPLPEETRNYVAIITGWTADEWASASPPKTSDTTIPQGIPCTRLANLILAPKAEAQRIAAYVPRWGMQLTANWSESKAWATYRLIQKQYAALIGDREPIVIRSRGIGLGSAMRYNIRIADDDRTYLDKFCNK
ncbi:MAG TPA: lytic transglycosylase domain-containing protein, partial [Xanthobacteraceae bacterium]